MIKIAVEQFAILSDTLPSDGISYTVSVGFKYSLDAGHIMCVFDLAFLNGDEKMLVLKTNCEFEVKQDDWMSFIRDGKIMIPKSFLEYLAVHTVGVARGIMYCKTEGTPFNSLILPPVNVAELITEGIEDPIEG